MTSISCPRTARQLEKGLPPLAEVNVVRRATLLLCDPSAPNSTCLNVTTSRDRLLVSVAVQGGSSVGRGRFRDSCGDTLCTNIAQQYGQTPFPSSVVVGKPGPPIESARRSSKLQKYRACDHNHPSSSPSIKTGLAVKSQEVLSP